MLNTLKSCSSFIPVLHTANGYIEIVKILLDSDNDVCTDDDYAFYFAFRNGHTKIIKMLLDTGANICANDDYALRMSATNRYTEIVGILFDADTDVYIDDDFSLCYVTNNGHIEMVAILLNIGANVRIECLPKETHHRKTSLLLNLDELLNILFINNNNVCFSFG